MSLENYHIIESTLREGEQFIGAQFTREQKIRIAHGLDGFGVEYLELTSPLASPGCLDDVKTIVGLGLHARILTHIRCHKDDAKIALETGVDGLDVVIGTSSQLRQFSHGKSIDEVIDIAAEVLTFIRSQAPNIELRFSTEDSFRSEEKELLRVYLAVDKLGVVNRLGTADTVGIATPTQVLRLVSTLRRLTTADIEFHGHNDSGCAVANAFAALEGGATHIDTTVSGHRRAQRHHSAGRVRGPHDHLRPRHRAAQVPAAAAARPRDDGGRHGRCGHSVQQLHHRLSARSPTKPASMPKRSSTRPRPTRRSIRTTSA